MRFAVAMLGLLIASVAAGEVENSEFGLADAKFFASVGLFAPNRKLRLGLDASVDISIPQPDPYVDFSEQVDLKSRDETFSAEFGWNFGERWQFRSQYFRIEDDERAALTEDVQWGDYIFNEGTSVEAGVNMQITRLFFGRRFWSSETLEAGLGIGGHLLDVSAFIAGNASIDGDMIGFIEERASVSQPLPNIGGWFQRVYADRWIVKARLDWLAANIDDYEGHIINSSIGLAYNFNDHFGIGLAYNLFEIDITIHDTDWKGRIRSRFQGPFISLNGYW